MARIKVKPNRAGIRALLADPGVQRDLMARAELVAASVRGKGLHVANGDDLPVEVVDASTTRARAIVRIPHPSGAGMVASHGVLLSDLDAAG